jgi:hypothetical protein
MINILQIKKLSHRAGKNQLVYHQLPGMTQALKEAKGIRKNGMQS